MTVSWNGAAVLAKVKAGAVVGLTRGVEAVRTEAVSLINTGPKTGRIYGRHQASAPGESPAGDTGQLANSIATSVDENALSGSLDFSSAHAPRMEYGFVGTDSLGRVYDQAPRPFARPALANKSAEIVKDIGEEIAKALR